MAERLRAETETVRCGLRQRRRRESRRPQARLGIIGASGRCRRSLVGRRTTGAIPRSPCCSSLDDGEYRRVVRAYTARADDRRRLRDIYIAAMPVPSSSIDAGSATSGGGVGNTLVVLTYSARNAIGGPESTTLNRSVLVPAANPEVMLNGPAKPPNPSQPPATPDPFRVTPVSPLSVAHRT